MDEKELDESDKLIEILEPGFSDKSEEDKENTRMKYYSITRYAKEINILLKEMKDPNSLLYQPSIKSDKDLIYFAQFCAETYYNTKNIYKAKDEVERSGKYYDEAKDKFENVRTTDEREMKNLIEMAISNYNSRPTIRVQNMINKLTKRKVPEINSKTVFNASEILESTLTEGKYIIDPNKERINPDKER